LGEDAMNGNVTLVKDDCVNSNCKNLWRIVEFGSCDCGNDYAKGQTQAEISWLKRHRKTVEIEKPLRRYTIGDIQEPLENLENAMNALVIEGERIRFLTKGISETVQRRKRNSRRKNAKITMQITVNGLEKSAFDTERYRKASLKKSNDTVMLGVLDGSIKSGEIQGWIEKTIRGKAYG
jgi:hypothetical protein